MSIKHLLVDLDGVIRHWPKDNRAIEEKFGLAENAIAKAAFVEELLIPAIRGQVTDYQWRQNIASRLSREFPGFQSGQAVVEWSQTRGVIDNDVLSVLGFYANVRLSLVTNATTRLASDLLAHGIVDAFDLVFNSCEIGFIKPEPQLFRYVLERIGAAPDEVVFIDDSEENVKAAQQQGIKAHHFASTEALRVFLGNTL